MTKLKNRGLEDILIACVDGLKGFPDAIAVEYPQTKVQLCIVHYGAQLAALCLLEGLQGGDGGPEADLPLSDGT